MVPKLLRPQPQRGVPLVVPKRQTPLQQSGAGRGLVQRGPGDSKMAEAPPQRGGRPGAPKTPQPPTKGGRVPKRQRIPARSGGGLTSPYLCMPTSCAAGPWPFNTAKAPSPMLRGPRWSQSGRGSAPVRCMGTLVGPKRRRPRTKTVGASVPANAPRIPVQAGRGFGSPQLWKAHTSCGTASAVQYDGGPFTKVVGTLAVPKRQRHRPSVARAPVIPNLRRPLYQTSGAPPWCGRGPGDMKSKDASVPN